MATGMGGAGIIMNWYSPAGVRIGIDASRRIGGHGDTCHGTGIVGFARLQRHRRKHLHDAHAIGRHDEACGSQDAEVSLAHQCAVTCVLSAHSMGVTVSHRYCHTTS